MKATKPKEQSSIPCVKCPYKLGLVHTVVNPCPQCRDNSYQMFERFQKDLISGEQGHR